MGFSQGEVGVYKFLVLGLEGRGQVLKGWAQAFPDLHQGGVFPGHETTEVGGRVPGEEPWSGAQSARIPGG